MIDLSTFLEKTSVTDTYKAKLCDRGGYLTFSNSGKRGDTKSFQISLDSLVQTFKDILTHIGHFSTIEEYDEKQWRDAGTTYFTDSVANANSASQTKSFFVTLSKLVKWANEPEFDETDTTRKIVINKEAIEVTIIKLNELADEYTPKGLSLENVPEEELAQRVKEGFIRYWEITDQHGASIPEFLAKFEVAMNRFLATIHSPYTDIFQIIDIKRYDALLARIDTEYPELSYLKDGRQNHRWKYEISSTQMHYHNYLEILSSSNFLANLNEQQKESQKLSMAEAPQLQRIYYGAPGTGKSYTIDNLTDETNSVRTTFHPDSDYASFVGAYKPTMEAVPISYVSDGKAKFAGKTDEHTGKERKIVYRYVPQAFLKAYVAAWSNLDEPFYLVIEEINRGNCAQIFGDLFQLLDRNNHGSSSYAIAADEDIAQFLCDDKKGFAGLTEQQRKAINNFLLIKDNGKEVAIGPSILNGTKLLLPPNLHIWATMNTSDQSLFPIDSAFKRRWDWKYVPIEYDKMNWMLEVGGKRYSWGAFLEKINPEIYTLTESADKQMGYFFAKPDKKSNPDLEDNDIISEEVFLNKVLFYLWTDVLKDYDLTKEPFVYESEDKKKKAFRFTDFFPLPNNPNLNKFVAGLGLTIIDEVPNDTSVTFDSEGDAELNTSQTESVRDNSKYSVNGTGSYTKSDAVVEVVKALVASMPTANANEVLDKIKSFGLSYTLVYNEKDYKYYFDRSTDSRFAKRYAEITLANGDKLYVYRGSTPDRIGELIKGLANTGTGITLAKTE